jgi:hypothetical protein
MGNYSRFVRPGYVRISATAAPATGVTVTAYVSAKDGKIVIIAANTNNSATSQAFSLTNATATKVTPWVTDANSDLVAGSSITPSANSFTYSLPSQSVTSLVVAIEGVSLLPRYSAGTEPSGSVKVHCGKSALRIEFKAQPSGLLSMKVFDLHGKAVRTMKFNAVPGDGYSKSFDLSNLPEGFYLVKIDHGEKIINKSKILLIK